LVKDARFDGGLIWPCTHGPFVPEKKTIDSLSNIYKASKNKQTFYSIFIPSFVQTLRNSCVRILPHILRFPRAFVELVERVTRKRKNNKHIRTEFRLEWNFWWFVGKRINCILIFCLNNKKWF
jgi:hypothetical protein